AYPGQRRFAPRVLALGMTAALVAAVFAAKLLTLALAWGLFDALFAIGVLARGGEAGAGRRAAFAVGFNGAATVCLWIAALLVSQADRSLYWHLTDLPEMARAWLALAATLRLGLYPLNQWLPTVQDDTPGRLALLYILPPLAGLHVLIRLAGLNALPQGSALAWLAALSMLCGGGLAWLRGRSRDALPYISLSGVGVIVLSGLSGGLTATPAAVIANGAASWALAMMALNVGRGFDRHKPWWSIAYALPFATLVGVPASVGFAVRTNLMAGLASSADSLLILLSLIGETLTFSALIRMATAPAKSEAPSGWPASLTYAAAAGLVALPPFLLPAFGRSLIPELAPPSFEVVLPSLGILGGVAMALPIALAIALEWHTRDRSVMPRFDPTGLISLDWLYSLTFRVVNGAARGLRGLGALIEGEGAILWALLILIAAYVVFSGAIQ
ncbi:MAG: proton-conducting transporter membrane subunit, partial [Anaerolineae bacterium]